jgi:butyryl-CoA dehydrogenase
MAYFQEVQKAIADAQTYDELKKYATKLSEVALTVQKVTQHLVSFAMKGDAERYLADATLYMEMFGIVAVAWQWLLQGTAAKKSLLKGGLSEEETAFYESKIHTMKFFFAYEIPKTLGLAARLMDDEVLTTEATIESALFV